MNKVGKFFRNLFFVLVALLVVLIIAFNIDTRKKKAAEVLAAEVPTVEAAANKTADNKPEVYVYWNGMQSALANLTKIKDFDKYYGIVSIADFEHFSDDDYLKTLESVEKSGISYLAVRCLDTNQVLVIHDVSRYGTASFGTMNERGDLQKLLYYFTIENGKVLRLTDAELDALESAKN